MGNTVTAGGLFDSLGIPADERTFLKRDLLKEIRNQSTMGGELSEVTEEDLTTITFEFVKSDQFLKRREQRPNPTSQEPPDDAQLHAWLLQLSMLWVNDRKRQVSQDDPSYSNSPSSTSFTSKKRKRSDISAQPRMQTKKPNTDRDDEQSTDEDTIQPTNRSVPALGRLKRRPEGFFPPRSATIASNSDSAHEDNNISYDDDIADDFDPPPASQLISDRSEPRNRNAAASVSEPHTPTASRKGKEPVRDPPSLSPGPTHYMMPPTKPASTNPPRASAMQPQSTRQTTNAATSSPKQVRSFRSMTEIETSDREVSYASSIQRVPSMDLSSLSQNPNVIINEGGIPPSPPPTTSRPYTKPNTTSTQPRSSTTAPTPALPVPTMTSAPTNPPYTSNPNPNQTTPTNTTTCLATPLPLPFPTTHSHSHPNPPQPALTGPRDEHMLRLIYQIVAYIGECETYNNSIADDESSSPREAQAHAIRAKAFAMLKRDVNSRIEAFLREDRRGVVSYCKQP